ncbi:flagellar biogenesis protein [Enterobacteriaceae bacterium RIT714]|nr:flagellar biogenesis protein [Enterobacteriaceae bacterium RIT714]
MTIKTFSLGMAIALFSSVLTASLAVMGTHYLSASKDGTDEEESPSSMQRIAAFFSSSAEAQPVKFVEMSNIVITLRSEGDKERYMLLELSLTALDDESAQLTEKMLPAIRGATVALLSEMDYTTVRALKLTDLHDKLMEAYKIRFKQLNNPVPFTDVIISKMLLQ